MTFSVIPLATFKDMGGKIYSGNLSILPGNGSKYFIDLLSWTYPFSTVLKFEGYDIIVTYIERI